ncbi:MAG: hypothetical protein RL328_425 [Acidobacteriota bacterium]|jgi:hypothetical protein
MVLKARKSDTAHTPERQVAAIGSEWDFFGSLGIRVTD